jgi:hypothetical protein
MGLNNEGHRMKVTKRQLKRIIREEKSRLLREQPSATDAAWRYGSHRAQARQQSPQMLRGKIRDEEQRLEARAAELFGEGIPLPSEDSIMDDPDQFADMLMNAMEKLKAASSALEEYAKAGW